MEELHEDQEQGEHQREDHEQVDRPGRQAPVAEQADIEQWVVTGQFGAYECDRSGEADDERSDGERAGPASFWAFLDREHEPADSEDRQDRAGDVEAGLDVFTGVGNHEHCRGE